MTNYVNHRYLRYYGATSALDAILGVRYVFDTEERRPGMADTGAGSGDTKVYRNENALPLAYFADTAALSALPEEGSPFTRQNALFNQLAGTADVPYFESLPVTAAFSGRISEADGRMNDRCAVQRAAKFDQNGWTGRRALRRLLRCGFWLVKFSLEQLCADMVGLS